MTVVNISISELAKLSPVGTIIGATIAFVGVFVTQALQAKEKRREREFAQRRDVFLQAAEALAKQVEVIASVGNVGLSPVDYPKMLQGNPGWLNKVYTVASLDTIEKMGRVSEHFALSLMKLVRERLRLDAVLLELESIRNETQSIRDYQREGIAALQVLSRQADLSEKQDQVGRLVTNIEQSKIRLEVIAERQRELEPTRNSLHRRLLEGAAMEAVELQRVIAPATLAIRTEMGLPVDDDRYLSIANKPGLVVREKLREMLDEIDSEAASRGKTIADEGDVSE